MHLHSLDILGCIYLLCNIPILKKDELILVNDAKKFLLFSGSNTNTKGQGELCKELILKEEFL